MLSSQPQIEEGFSVTEEGTSATVKYTNGVYQFTTPWKRDSTSQTIYYFEASIQSNSDYVGIGVAKANYSSKDMPGWLPGSYAYHGDDGGRAVNDRYKLGWPQFGTGSVVGIGLKAATGELFGTLDGKILGAVAIIEDESEYFPTIGLNGSGELRVCFADFLISGPLNLPLVPSTPKDVELQALLAKLTSAANVSEKVTIMEQISNLFDRASTDPLLAVVQSTDLIKLLAEILNEDKQLANIRCIWAEEILNATYRYLQLDIPKDQTAFLLRVLKEYTLINDSGELSLTLIWFVVHSSTAQQVVMEDTDMYRDVLREKLTAKCREDVEQIFQILARELHWQLKILKDKQFVANTILDPDTAAWSLLQAMCMHPDAKSLLPIDEILQKATNSKEYIETRESVVAILSNEQGISTYKLNLRYVEDRAEAFDYLLATQNQPKLVYNYRLLNVMVPLVNLSIADDNKEILGSKFITPLLKVLAIQTDKPLSPNVAINIDRTKQEAARTLWNLTFLEANQNRILENGGLDLLRAVLNSTSDTTLKQNVAGVLYMLGPSPQLNLRASFSKHVMISYNWANQPTVLRLSKTLKSFGYNIWLDVEKMQGSILESMAEAIEGADIVLMCVTQKYKDSPNCRLEGEYCVKRGIPFIPLLMQNGYKADGWLGITLGHKMYFNFATDYDWDNKIASLMKAIGNLGRLCLIPALPIANALNTSTTVAVPNIAPQTWTPEELFAWMKKEEIEHFHEAFVRLKINKKELLELKALLLSPQNALKFIREMFNTTHSEVLRLTAAVRKL